MWWTILGVLIGGGMTYLSSSRVAKRANDNAVRLAGIEHTNALAQLRESRTADRKSELYEQMIVWTGKLFDIRREIMDDVSRGKPSEIHIDDEASRRLDALVQMTAPAKIRSAGTAQIAADLAFHMAADRWIMLCDSAGIGNASAENALDGASSVTRAAFNKAEEVDKEVIRLIRLDLGVDP